MFPSPNTALKSQKSPPKWKSQYCVKGNEHTYLRQSEGSSLRYWCSNPLIECWDLQPELPIDKKQKALHKRFLNHPVVALLNIRGNCSHLRSGTLSVRLAAPFTDSSVMKARSKKFYALPHAILRQQTRRYLKNDPENKR
jgi:hypothetical protein